MTYKYYNKIDEDGDDIVEVYYKEQKGTTYINTPNFDKTEIVKCNRGKQAAYLDSLINSNQEYPAILIMNKETQNLVAMEFVKKDKYDRKESPFTSFSFDSKTGLLNNAIANASNVHEDDEDKIITTNKCGASGIAFYQPSKQKKQSIHVLRYEAQHCKFDLAVEYFKPKTVLYKFTNQGKLLSIYYLDIQNKDENIINMELEVTLPVKNKNGSIEYSGKCSSKDMLNPYYCENILEAFTEKLSEEQIDEDLYYKSLATEIEKEVKRIDKVVIVNGIASVAAISDAFIDLQLNIDKDDVDLVVKMGKKKVKSELDTMQREARILAEKYAEIEAKKKQAAIAAQEEMDKLSAIHNISVGVPAAAERFSEKFVGMIQEAIKAEEGKVSNNQIKLENITSDYLHSVVNNVLKEYCSKLD